ncbi:unnamed protein product [marine sediment metagenome]|uniref:Uncharacterized protein n=2 Tax=marine sediment metagenome TaxID=412755 RepID=X1UDE9_9ZZZZ
MLFNLGNLLKRGELKLVPEKLEFLNRFDSFYQVIVNAVKEDKINERDFYIIIGAKCKSMNQERREKENLNRPFK